MSSMSKEFIITAFGLIHHLHFQYCLRESSHNRIHKSFSNCEYIHKTLSTIIFGITEVEALFPRAVEERSSAAMTLLKKVKKIDS